MAPSRHDWKIVDWDVKPQHNQPTNQPTNQPFSRYELLDGARTRMKTDGLNAVRYRLLKMEDSPLYTCLYVQLNQSDDAFDTGPAVVIFVYNRE